MPCDQMDPMHPVDLSDRQRKIHDLISKGLSNKAIAHALGIREATVKTHVTALLRRLGVTSRTQAGLRGWHHNTD